MQNLLYGLMGPVTCLFHARHCPRPAASEKRRSRANSVFTTVVVAMVAGCSYSAGGGVGSSSAYPVGWTQDQVVARLGAQERVMFREDELIVDSPTGRRRYEFR